MNADPAWDAAVELYDALQHGYGLPVLESPVILDPGEVLHAQVSAYGWRYHAVDVAYDRQGFFAFGGLAMLGASLAATAIGNRRTRAAAEQLAAPQWRPLGDLPILATNQRLLVFYEQAWASVWLAGIRQLLPAPAERRLEMTFDDDPPYALWGPWVPYLSVVMSVLVSSTAPPITPETPSVSALPPPAV